MRRCGLLRRLQQVVFPMWCVYVWYGIAWALLLSGCALSFFYALYFSYEKARPARVALSIRA